MSLQTGRDFALPFVIPQTELLAGAKIDFPAPFDGRVDELQIAVQAAVTTGGAITVEITPAGGSPTAVAGLSITVADAATKGTVQSDKPTEPSTTRAFKKGDLISIVPAAAFNTAGAINGNLLVNASPGERA